MEFRNLDMIKVAQVMYRLLGEQFEADVEVVLEKKEGPTADAVKKKDKTA